MYQVMFNDNCKNKNLHDHRNHDMTREVHGRVSLKLAVGMNTAALLLFVDLALLGKTLHVQAILCNISTSYQGLGTDISIDHGKPLVINCSVAFGNWAESIVWSRRETQMSLASTEHASPGRWEAIVFREVTVNDTGKYECLVKKASKQELCEITLHVNFPPELLRTQGHFTTSPQLVYAGTDPTFHCYACGWPKPTITWLRNSSEIQNGDNGQSFWLDKKQDGVDLRILSVSRREHAGLYTCLAENKMGRRHYVIWVRVESLILGLPPRVSPESSNVTVTKGSYVNLTCTAVNTMEIRTVLYWMFNGTKVSYKAQQQKQKWVTWHYYTEGHIPKVNFSLALPNVTESDTGDYYCSATTTHGQDRKKVRLSLAKMEGGENTKKRRLPFEEIIFCSASLMSGLLIVVITYRLKLRRQRHLRSLETKDYQYDLFVSFSGSDFDWVKEKLMPLLEKQQIKFCIHHRDFEVGKAILENIADSVYNSKKVLAVISEHYINSKFCQEELEIAMYRCTEMADSSLLLIKIDDVSKNSLPRPLRRRTFLDYTNSGEKRNWEQRLLKQIQREDRTCDAEYDKVHLIARNDAGNTV